MQPSGLVGWRHFPVYTSTTPKRVNHLRQNPTRSRFVLVFQGFPYQSGDVQLVLLSQVYIEDPNQLVWLVNKFRS
jgi:hypothetical protein